MFGKRPQERSASKIPVTLGVLVVTYHRSTELLRCLRSLKEQTRTPDDIVVVAREDDGETLEALSLLKGELPALRVVTVDQPGVVFARNAGCEACRTDIFCMTDDDAVPMADWLQRILDHFTQDPRLGGLGGRDRCFDGEAFDDRREPLVGQVQWFGRVIGNHHLGFGAARSVDVLKGVNMSYRSEAFAGIRFSPLLKGSGAQPGEDKYFSLAVKHAGWKLIYDPSVLVYHYTGNRDEIRHYVGVIPLQEVTGFWNFAFNECVAIWEFIPLWRRVAFVIWSVLIGTGVSPGAVQAIRFTPRLGLGSWRRFAIQQQGKFAALRALIAQDASTRKFFKR